MHLPVRIYFLIAVLIIASFRAECQPGTDVIDSFWMNNEVKITIDKPANFNKKRKTIITFYALPNGNTTEQTMGKRITPGDDWHYDIQHIRAQTKFIRNAMKRVNFVVIYLENIFISWPAWKRKHEDYRILIPHFVDSLAGLIGGKQKVIYFNGHSGGGSFIFGYLSAVEIIPSQVRRISFIDSDYGYDSSYYPKIRDWLKHNHRTFLNVFAYNDSIALYNGKPFVSPTGGTWYRSHLFLQHLAKDFTFTKSHTDSLVIYKSPDKRIQFFFKINTDQGIYHTQQVELNGFIHSVLCGTQKDSNKYKYYVKRDYDQFIY